MLKVLIADDQPAVRSALEVLFDINGIGTLSAQTPDEALHLVTIDDVGVVVQDMNFSRDKTSGQEGVDLFHAIQRLDNNLPVLLMTAFTSLETAVQLVKEGAADYIAKPWDDDKLIRTVSRLLHIRELELERDRARAQSARARRELQQRADLRGLVFHSPAMHHVVSLAVHIAPSDAPVLITGPNGSGKEKIAEIIQANSRRSDKPFVKINAGGIPDTLLEAELFGAEAGAFTGAAKLRIGRFEAADGGTLFLDEIGNLSLSGQAKLLRVLETGEFERLGSSAARRASVRILSATNLDLTRAIADGSFREDLYFRLNVIELAMPPLVERSEEVLALAEHFLALHGPSKTLSPRAAEAILHYDWPGNVRELQNRVQRGALVAPTDRIEPEHLGLTDTLRLHIPRATTPGAATLGAPTPRNSTAETLRESEMEERKAIEAALAVAAGVVSKAAIELGLSRQALYRRMERLGVTLERRVK